MATQDDYIRTALRVPPELHKRIHEAASANNRTFNAEIVARLDRSFMLDLSQAMPKDPMSNERVAELLAALESGGVTLIPVGTAKITRP